MPYKPKTICNYPGCNQLIHGTYCEKHKKIKLKEYSLNKSKLYTYQWRKLAKQFLKDHPFCCHCDQAGIIKVATEVDHIIPHKENGKLFWDKSNWQALCKSCHSKKTAQEDGGFGNKQLN